MEGTTGWPKDSKLEFVFSLKKKITKSVGMFVTDRTAEEQRCNDHLGWWEWTTGTKGTEV